MKLGMIMLFVPDLDEAKRFYCDVLGFEIKSELVERLEFIHETIEFIAFKCEEPAITREYGRAARSVFVFDVESIVYSMRELKARGVKFVHEKPAENELCRYAAFFDPFGNVHELCERK
ncbi:MAG TPA: VOC family protein [Pyrinomonadaceae bacterium]|nr:VOC family protein [Pyrinomonadaceae bacterium]